MSLYHQGRNIDRARLRQLTGAPEPAGRAQQRLPLREWLLAWVDQDVDPRRELDSLPRILWHLGDAC